MTTVFLYSLVAVLGVLSMGFQLLASRLLGPYFGSSIIVWAWLISTFLAAFSVGSALGGWVSGLALRLRGRVQVLFAVLGSLSLGGTAFFGRDLLGSIEVFVTSMNTGLFAACVGLFFFPVVVLSSFGPQCVQFMSTRGRAAGAASGVVYAVSTIGNIVGVMLTAFALIPNFRISTLLLVWTFVGAAAMAALVVLLNSPAGKTSRLDS